MNEMCKKLVPTNAMEYGILSGLYSVCRRVGRGRSRDSYLYRILGLQRYCEESAGPLEQSLVTGRCDSRLESRLI